MNHTEARHRLTLHFLNREVEVDYQQKLRPRARERFRVSCGSSIFLWILSAILCYPLVESGVSILIGVPTMILLLLSLLFIERRTETLRGLHYLGAISNTSAGLTVVTLCWIEGFFVALGPMSTVVVAVYSFTLLALPFLTSLFAIMPYVILCIVFMVISPAMPFLTIQIVLLLIVTSVLALGSYMRETASRRDFFLTRVIAGQERELVEEKAKRLGQYTLLSKLGQGGMGVVYLAKHALLRRLTAIKLLSTENARPGQLEKFEREVQLTSELSHPNIIGIYDYGRSHEGEFYYVMEYLPGTDLESMVADWGPLPPERAIPILIQISDGLNEAHQSGLIHRDIKPANIILSRIGTRLDVVKILDFGLVQRIEHHSDLPAKKRISGTPDYMSPEAILTPGEVGPANDQYALGAVGFYLLTGQRVFTGSSLKEIFSHHVHTQPRPPSSISKYYVAHELDEVILRCLAKRPTDRFHSASDVRAALKAIKVGAYSEGESWWDTFEQSQSSENHPPSSCVPSLTVDWNQR